MAKTNVILIKNVEGLGAESDQVNVATGFARNYLLPQGLAIPLTQGNERHLEALRKQRQERELQEAKDAKELAAGFKQLMLIIKAKQEIMEKCMDPSLLQTLLMSLNNNLTLKSNEKNFI